RESLAQSDPGPGTTAVAAGRVHMSPARRGSWRALMVKSIRDGRKGERMPATSTTGPSNGNADSRWACVLAALLLLAPAGALAQPYPARTVRVIVPYSAGANADLIARIVTQNVAATWGQQVILDNRPGGATNIGSALAAKSPPDGYTLLLAG